MMKVRSKSAKKCGLGSFCDMFDALEFKEMIDYGVCWTYGTGGLKVAGLLWGRAKVRVRARGWLLLSATVIRAYEE